MALHWGKNLNEGLYALSPVLEGQMIKPWVR